MHIRMYFETKHVKAVQGHLRSLISVLMESNFLLAINSNPLPHFRDIAGFCQKQRPPPIPSKFWGVPLGLDRRCSGSEERRS